MRFSSRLLWCTLLACSCVAAQAQGYPTRPVRILVGFTPGGTTDVVARQLAQKLQDAWGQSVVVENKPGAGGNIGSDLVAKSANDGYTLLMTSGSIVAANPHMYKNMGFDPAKDLAPITNVASGPQVIVVGTSVAARDLKEFIAYAKANPKKVNFGSAGIGTGSCASPLLTGRSVALRSSATEIDVSVRPRVVKANGSDWPACEVLLKPIISIASAASGTPRSVTPKLELPMNGGPPRMPQRPSRLWPKRNGPLIS